MCAEGGVPLYYYTKARPSLEGDRLTLSSSLPLVKFPSRTARSKLSVKNDPHKIRMMKKISPRIGKLQSFIYVTSTRAPSWIEGTWWRTGDE